MKTFVIAALLAASASAINLHFVGESDSLEEDPEFEMTLDQRFHYNDLSTAEKPQSLDQMNQKMHIGADTYTLH